MSKGSNFERLLCKQLSDWWEPGRDDIFWRTANSGGRATSRGKKGKSTRFHSGDIAAVDPIGQPFISVFALEAKRGYSKFTCADLLDKPDGAAKQKWEEWYEQVWASQARSGAYSWMLITKRDRREALVFLPLQTWKELGVPGSVPEFRFGVKLDKLECIVGMHLKAFLTLVQPRDIKALHEAKGLNK